MAFLVHQDLLFETVTETPGIDPYIETLSIKLDGVQIVNIYIPPQSSCPAGFKPTITPLLPECDAIITGDINAHDALWNSSLQDTRGDEISVEIGDSNFRILNTESPTCYPPNGQPT